MLKILVLIASIWGRRRRGQGVCREAVDADSARATLVDGALGLTMLVGFDGEGMKSRRMPTGATAGLEPERFRSC